MLERRHDARLLARQVDAGGLAEAERAHPVVEARRARPCRPIVIAPTLLGLREDLRRGQRLVAVSVGVVDRAVGDLDLRREVERRRRRDHVLLQRAGDGERP